MIPGIFGARRGGGIAVGSSSVERWGTDASSQITPSRTSGIQVETVASGKSGGPDATQSTEADRPIYDTTSIPGFPVLRFAAGLSLGITPDSDIERAVVQVETSQLSDGDVILSRPTSAGGTSKAAFELRLIVE